MCVDRSVREEMYCSCIDVAVSVSVFGVLVKERERGGLLPILKLFSNTQVGFR